MRNIDFMSIIITLFTTVIGTMFGGIVTLTVNKRFEIDKLRLNNIDETGITALDKNIDRYYPMIRTNTFPQSFGYILMKRFLRKDIRMI